MLSSWTASTTISAITLIVAIVAPVVSTRLTNKHQERMFDLESNENRYILADQRRYEACKNFIADTGRYIALMSNENHAKFGASFFAVYQYVPEGQWDQLDSLYRSIVDGRWDEARKSFAAITRIISTAPEQQA